MTALATIRPAQPTLDELKAERDTILKRLASIKETRSRLAEADHAVEIARNAVRAFAGHHEERINEWAKGACNGPRPVPSHAEHDELEARLHKALISASSNPAAMASLAAREAEERRAFAAVERPIRIAAVEQICGSLDEVSDETIELREKLDANEKSLLAAHVLIRDIGKVVDRDGMTKIDSVFVMAAASIRGIDLPSREEWRPVDAEYSKYWAEELDNLVK